MSDPNSHPAASITAALARPVHKAYHTGTHRLRSPTETVALMSQFTRSMGITRIADVTGLDCIGVPVVMVCRPNARSLSVSQGKGLDLAAAKASGLMECAELYHAERIQLPLKYGSYEEMRRAHRVVNAMALPSTLGSLFHPELPIFWIEGYDLLQDECVWLPYELVHTNYTLPQLPGSGCFDSTSNGLASGNHLLEAITHGIYEVIERDATSLWHRRSLDARRVTQLHLITVDDPGCCEVLEKCARAGVSIAAWEMTTEIGLPVFECLLVEEKIDPLRPLCGTAGMGCHATREIALLRALTEAVQSRLTFIAGSRDDLFRTDYYRAYGHDKLLDACVQTAGGQPARAFHAAPTTMEQTFNDDIAWALNGVRAAGFDRVIVVDLSRPELPIAVVRVVIPGLEGVDHHPTYVPGARARALLGGQA